MQNKSMLRNILIISMVVLNIGCDQISKDIVRKNVNPNEQILIVGKNFIVTNVENTGAMLGFGQHFPPIIKIIVLQVIPVIVLLVLLYRILKKKDLNKYLITAFAFVIGGGIGNLIDRIIHGSVTDFFFVEIGIFKTGIFNVADISVTLGVLIILSVTIFGKKQIV